MPVVRLGGARHQLQQRRLAGAVDAHDAPALLAAHQEVEPVVDAPRAVALVHVFELATSSPERGAGRELERDRSGGACGGSTRSILSSFFTRLCTCAACEARALNRSMKLDLLGEHRLLALVLRLLLRLAQRALLLVEIVVAGIGRQRAAVDLDDLGDDAVHELAVVRGHQQRALDSP